MGNSSSKSPEVQVSELVAQNNLATLQRLLNQLRAQGTFNPSRHLEWADKQGRTPLLIAANRDHYQAAKMLLDWGANVLYVNPVAGDEGGTALHEATRARKEGMVDLLMAYGAYPFQCNASGKTCLDEAVIKQAGNLLRKYEQATPWRGTVAIKTYKLAGLAQPFKARHMVVVPQLPASLPNQPTPPMRRQLWIFRDKDAVEPRCRVWLDGATAQRTGPGDAILRLHQVHKQPQGDVSTRFDRGYCLYLRPADSSPGALVTFEQLLSHINSPGVPVLPGRRPQAPPAVGHTPAPALPSNSGPSTAGGTPPPSGLPRLTYASGTALASKPDFVDHMNALPGETDAEFANRLASAITAGSSSTPSAAPSSQPSGTGPLPSIAATPPAPQTPTPAATSTQATTSPAFPAYPPVPPAGIMAPPVAATPSAPPLASAPPRASPLPPSTEQAKDDDALCVICLSAPREAGYLHGATLHRCVCQECCSQLRVGDACPLCRQPVERIVGVF